MQNFREALSRVLDATVTEEMRSPWEDVLRDFVRGINDNRPNVVAFIRKGIAPGVEHLVFAPRGQRDKGHNLLSVYINPAGLSVISGDRREFTAIDDFQSFLLAFAGSPSFRDALDFLSGEASKPILGFLRFGDVKDRTPSRDIVVTIELPEQRKLADAAEKPERPEVEMIVEPRGASPIGQGVYTEASTLRWLVAGGYALRIQSHGPVPGGVSLTGTPLAPDTLD